MLQDDLIRAGISPWAWVVNNSLAAARPTSAFLQRRAAAEVEQIHRVEVLTPRVAIVPLLAVEPIGETPLATLGLPRKAVPAGAP